LGEIERQSREPEGLDYVKVSLGLVFVFGAFVFGILAPPGTLVISFGLMIPAVALLASALQEANKRRRALPLASDKERELLSAIRDNGGVMTPMEAAIETSLTVKEADRRLSELAGGGHLSVERAGRSAIRSPADRRPSSTNPVPLPNTIRRRRLPRARPRAGPRIETTVERLGHVPTGAAAWRTGRATVRCVKGAACCHRQAGSGSAAGAHRREGMVRA
jgi:hypothetical protein